MLHEITAYMHAIRFLDLLLYHGENGTAEDFFLGNHASQLVLLG